MIDDITIALKVSGLGMHPIEHMMQLDPVRNRPTKFGRVAAQGLYVMYTPTEEIVNIRISVPRWTQDKEANYPLVPLRSVKDLRPHTISVLVAKALGVTLSSIKPEEADMFFPVASSAVIRASYAADLVVSDPIGCIRGCMGIQRRNAGRFHSEGHPTVSTIHWFSKSYGVKLYAKGLELEHRARTKPILSDYFKELADHARNTVRFEVSFRQVRALRRFWYIEDGRLPTLALMCDPNTVRLALAMEAQRMRLYEDTYESLSTESYAQRIRQIGATIRSIKERLASGELKRCGRRKSLTPQRIMNLVAAYSLLTAYSPGELTQQFGFSKSKINELRRDLREIGLQADSSSTGTLAESVQELAERLRPFVFAPRAPPDWWDASSFVDAPWGDAEEGDNENDETNIATVSSGEVNLSGSDEELAIRAILASL